MSLLDVLLEPAEQSEGQSCKIGRILIGLDEPYQSALTELLAGDLPDERVLLVMKKAGLNASYSTLYRHRRWICVCESVVNV